MTVLRECPDLSDYLGDACDHARVLNLSSGQRLLLRVAVHESGHAVAAAALGGRVRKVVTRPGYVPGTKVWAKGYTQWHDVPDGHEPAVTFAGPWAEARWLAGRRPGWPGLRLVFARGGSNRFSDERRLYAYGGYSPESFGVAALLEPCWPAVITLAQKMLRRPNGRGCHDDVCEALGIPETTADHTDPDSPN